jgi:hypothetical protein
MADGALQQSLTIRGHHTLDCKAAYRILGRTVLGALDVPVARIALGHQHPI